MHALDRIHATLSIRTRDTFHDTRWEFDPQEHARSLRRNRKPTQRPRGTNTTDPLITARLLELLD